MISFVVINFVLLFVRTKEKETVYISLKFQFQIWQNLVNAVFEHRTQLKFVPVTFVNKDIDQGLNIMIIFAYCALYKNA